MSPRIKSRTAVNVNSVLGITKNIRNTMSTIRVYVLQEDFSERIGCVYIFYPCIFAKPVTSEVP